MSTRMRITSSHMAGGTLTLSGIPEELFEKVEGVINGHQWMLVENGVPRFASARAPLPDPRVDDELLPYWQSDVQRQYRLEGLVFGNEERGYHSPSFMVSHLCGYHYTPEKYREQAELLESYGFVCMRSRRGDDGQFWEIWYLPGAWAAKGALKERVTEVRTLATVDNLAKSTRRETDAVVAFLCRNASFGSLDVVIQRAAMSVE